MFKSPFSFKGRIRRLEYGLSYLIYIFLYLALISLWDRFGWSSNLFIVFLIPCFWFLFAQGGKRSHDIGNSGFFQFIPFYGLWLLFQQGEELENQYGPNPKETKNQYAREEKDINPIYILIGSTLILIMLVIFSVKYADTFTDKPMITWSERPLVWEDFELVHYMDEDYVALIYSGFYVPNIITDNNSKVYAYMNPNESERLRGEYDGYNVLTHEQYHFNIAEYCARLLRKEIVEKGLGGLSYKTINTLNVKYAKKLDSLQNVYDSITDHNANSDLQRYWELKTDDLLRQTANFENEDIYSYYNFAKNPTKFYRQLYFTHTDKVLTSFPVTEKEYMYGETYEVLFPNRKENIIKFYKDGKLTNGGYFKTAITRILEKEKGVFEMYYLNADATPNKALDVCLRKSFWDEAKNKTNTYYDASGNRISKNSVYETKWKYTPEKSTYISTYYDQNGRKISNEENIYHEKRILDKKERTILFENLDSQMQAMNDDRYIAKYDIEFNKNNGKTFYRVYDENGDLAYHLGDYHLGYKYDERGNIIEVTSLNEDGEPIYDDNGASIYAYTYDRHNRETSVKRYGKEHHPIIANDDYFQSVKKYDSLGRIEFEGYYYPEYVLKYKDSKWGATKYVYEEDDVILEKNISAYGYLTESKENIAIIKKRLNRKKQTISEIYLDSNENFAKTSDGASEYRYSYNDNGNTVKTSAYDSLGHSKAFEADVAAVIWEYDNNGNKSKTIYFDSENELAYATDSTTYNIYKYNNQNQLIERTNYNIDMKPSTVDGAFRTSYIINKAGLDSIQFEYDVTGKLKKGVSIVKYYYNKYDTKIRTEYYDASSNRIKNSSGVSAIDVIYNERQFLIGYKYYDKYNKLTNRNDGVSIEEWQLDALGHTLNYRCFDKNKNAVIGPNGYHKIENEWNQLGETSQTSIYDENLVLIEDEYGTAIYEYSLKPSGQYSEIRRFNKNAVLAENNLGVAITTYGNSLNGLYYLNQELNATREVVNDTLSE